MAELLAGCGSNRHKQIIYSGPFWKDLTTLDVNDDHHPDVVWNLMDIPWPFDDSHFDEIHMYEVLEHLGQQGDYVTFFAQFTEIWRTLKPEGLFCATVPSLHSPWLWADPSHTRVIAPGTLGFLSQKNYDEVGMTAMSDFRNIYHADFQILESHDNKERFSFILKAVK